jgi:hypothetical protein
MTRWPLPKASMSYYHALGGRRPLKGEAAAPGSVAPVVAAASSGDWGEAARLIAMVGVDKKKPRHGVAPGLQDFRTAGPNGESQPNEASTIGPGLLWQGCYGTKEKGRRPKPTPLRLVCNATIGPSCPKPSGYLVEEYGRYEG